MWYNILEFLNIAGVITNAFIIAFESHWGSQHFTTDHWKLLAVLVFEVSSALFIVIIFFK